jgi:hypothetical protein
MAVLPTGIGPVTGYNVERSLRFNSADSAYLSRTPASASNRDTWTFSGWVKRSKLGMSNAIVFGSGDTYVNFETDRLAVNLRAAATNYLGISTAKFRDVSAWYHIVVAVDTTQATAADRLKMWVNNQLITAFDVSSYLNIPVNTDTAVNSTNAHNIGRYTGTGEHFDGYMTEINFIDGQALTPSSFGETDAQTGVWKPKAYSSTYGTNGFFLKFADNSGTTSTTLGKDSSGNSNNWTPNNFSVTAGAGNDSLVDSPTAYGTDTGVGGSVRGNYATLNPLASSGTFTNGNLDLAVGSTAESSGIATMAVGASGKYYWEVLVTAVGGDYMIGIYNGQNTLNPTSSGTFYGYRYNGQKVTVSGSTYGASYTTNDIIGVAVDMDAGTITFYKNGSSQGQAFSGISGGNFRPSTYLYNNASKTANFGQRPFAYTAPSGFKALCTTNLPTPTIGATSTTQANDYMNVVLWTGNGSTTRGITGVGFQPDFTWIKTRSGSSLNHTLFNAIVGGGANKGLASNTTASEASLNDDATYGYLNTFDSDGFTVAKGSSGGESYTNASSYTYVAWNWNAGGSTVTNTSGTISAQVRANTTSGFSIVTYTGTGANATVGHGLGVAPKMIIGKRRSGVADWMVGHSGVNGGTTPFNYYLVLNSTAAQSADSTAWNNTAPTSTVFSLGSGGNVNSNTATNVMYCFAEVAGYSAFGSYTGNGSTDGPFVYTGFRPRFVMIKRTDSTSDWTVWDTSRNTYNQMNLALYPNLSNAEVTTSIVIDTVSNGIKIRNSNADTNASGGTYIYMALAESPFKFSLAR